ncbi:MAG: methyl-accepting chemotaxis protein [Pleurocapsa sp.]
MTDSQYQPPTSNTDDCVSKIIEASSLEKSGQIESAIALYEQVLELDRGGNYGAVAEKALANLQQSVTVSVDTTTATKTKSDASWWGKLSLRWKVTGLAIALGTIPVIALGFSAYSIAAKTIGTQITQAEATLALEMADKLSLLMYERYGNIQIIAKAGILHNPTIRDATTPAQKDSVLTGYLQDYPFFDSIAAFDLEGNLLAQSQGEKLSNHKDRSYFQEVIKTKKTFISDPMDSQSSGVFSIYIAAPIVDRDTQQMIGVVRARMPVETMKPIFANYGTNNQNYQIVDSSNITFLSSNEEWKNKQLDANLSEVSAAKSNADTGVLESKNLVTDKEQLVAFSSTKALEAMPPVNWNSVISVDKDIAFAVEKQLLSAMGIGILITVAAVSALAAYLSYKGTAPLLESTEAVKKLGQGNLDVRTNIKGSDELAELGSNINLMAEQIQELLKKQEAEAWKQRQEKEALQTGVMNLLLDVEGAQKGDLTVQAQMTDGAIGSIADAFNATINRLRRLLEQVQTVSTEVGQLSQTGESSVRQLSEAALTQAEEINQALSNIAEINESVENVAKFAQEAAQIAREGLVQAKEGDRAMDETVNSIEKIRTTVATTSKKAKQLAESSQEIAQIVDIISGISEKTNLLAFNASVEAARAGEHGEGFRIVAEEVRRLADRITESTKDIQQLVSTIQQDTTSVLQGMETSTTEVVNGSELIRLTKQNLRRLATTSENINQYLQSISSSTIEQTNTSRQVNEKITGIATIARNNSTEAQDVVQSLRTLVQEAETLQTSVSQFKLKA